MTTGIYLGQDDLDTKNAPQVPATLSEIGQAASYEQWYQGPIAETAIGLQQEYDSYYNPGQISSWKQERDNTLQHYQSVLDRSPDGIVPDVAKLVGSAIGWSLDPANTLTAFAAPQLIGTKIEGTLAGLAADKIASESLNKASTLFLRAAPVAAKGAAEASLMAQPYNAAHLLFSKPLNENYGFWDAAMNTWSFAKWGGGLGAIGGAFKSPVDKLTMGLAAESAVANMASDMEVDISPIIKNSLANEQANLTPKLVDGLKERSVKLSDEIKATSDTIDATKAEIDSTYGEDDVSLGTSELPAHSYIRMAGQALAKQPEARTNFEQALINNKNVPSEIKEGLDAINRNPVLSSTDREFISSISPENEVDFLNKKKAALEDQQDTINTTEIGEKINNKVLTKTGKKLALNKIKKELQFSNDRLNNLPLKEPHPIDIAHQQLSDLMDRHAALAMDLDRTNALINYSSAPLEPLRGNEFKQYMQKLMDNTNERPLRKIGESLGDMAKELPDQPENFTEDLAAKVKVLQDQGLLNEEDLKEINLSNEELADQKNYTKLIKRGMNCLMRNVDL